MQIPLDFFRVTVHAPVRLTPPTRFRIPFYAVPQHTIPTRWSLYRPLLKTCISDLHRQVIRARWRQRNRRYCTSPQLTIQYLHQEQRWLQDYKHWRECQGHVDLVRPQTAARIAKLDTEYQQRLRNQELESIFTTEFASLSIYPS